MAKLFNPIVLRRGKTANGNTLGTVRFPSGALFKTVELEWQDNKRSISHIPPGTYRIVKRSFGGMFNRINASRKRQGLKPYRWIFEIQGIPYRSAVLFHAVGYPWSGLQGCVATYGKLSTVPTAKLPKFDAKARKYGLKKPKMAYVCSGSRDSYNEFHNEMNRYFKENKERYLVVKGGGDVAV